MLAVFSGFIKIKRNGEEKQAKNPAKGERKPS
jgi:hypothetical protein